jgi:tRNA(fMet)-specific endonuclease VapC
MPLRYLLDTNICIYIAKARPEAVLERFKKMRPGAAAMSAITYGELCFGACKSRHRAEAEKILRELTAIIPILGVDAKVCDRYGAIRAQLEKEGRIIGNNDLWIAAHALALGVALVTNNEREFERVPGLSVQNWARGQSRVHEKTILYGKRH